MVFARKQGYTLIELATALSIAVVLLTMAVVGFGGLIRQHRLTTAVNDLFSAINLARSEAVQRGARVDLVPAGDGSDWAAGWTVFIDDNGNHRPDTGEKIVMSHGPVRGMTIQSRFTDAAVPYLAYNASGRSRTHANSQTPQFGTMLFTLDDQARKIKINFLGRPRTCNPGTDGSSC
jgi:type IV fimbrial biogenesis protein FimT